MLSKASIHLVKSLANRKSRHETGLFVAEGPRLVEEVFGQFRCKKVFATSEWLEKQVTLSEIDICEVNKEELSRLSLQQSPNQVLALFEIPQEESIDINSLSGLHLALDNIQDPGNLGTIVRIADWFGVEHIWCSPTTVDVWNPKVVQASMGGISRVRVHYLNISELISKVRTYMPVYATTLQGQTIWRQNLASDAMLVMGNEGNGISKEVEHLCTQSILIPNYPIGRFSTDSLNVAIATGIVLAEIRRQEFKE